MNSPGKRLFSVLACLLLLVGRVCPAQGQQGSDITKPAAVGSISGTVADPTGAAIGGALVTLSRGDRTPAQKTETDNDGKFSFSGAAAGAFHLDIAVSGFTTQSIAGILAPAEALAVPTVVMAVRTFTTDVQVTSNQTEVAEEQIKAQEQQRLLGVVPNYYVSYVPDAAPLNRKQKFELTGKFVLDPVSFGITGIIAGVQQARDDYGGFGQGAEGYGKRYGASYADFLIGSAISGAILPAVLKQDPRFFYKATGSKRSRILYALATAVICKGDNGRWQPNYSNIIGSLASAGISNLYYPAEDRNGAGLTFENTLIGIAGTAGGNLFQEFFSRKLTPKAGSKKPAIQPGP